MSIKYHVLVVLGINPEKRVPVDAIGVAAYYHNSRIGHASLALKNEVGVTWGQEVHILHVDI